MSGAQQLNRYTRPETGLSKGGDLPGLTVDGSMTLTTDTARYIYTNLGNGLVVYQYEKIHQGGNGAGIAAAAGFGAALGAMFNAMTRGFSQLVW